MSFKIAVTIIMIGVATSIVWAMYPPENSRCNGELERYDLTVDGNTRPYYIFVPGADAVYPIVVVLHGGGGALGNPEHMLEKTGWKENAERECLALVLPSGTPENPELPVQIDAALPHYNPLTWNDHSGDTGASRRGVDDVKYIERVLADAQEKISIDDRRIYVTGFSNGASLTYILGTLLSDRIAAIAPVEGAFYADVRAMRLPVSLMTVYGMPSRVGESISLPQIGDNVHPALQWQQHLACSESESEQDESRIFFTFSHCADDALVSALQVFNAGHEYPPKITPEIWRFFELNSKN